MIDLQSLTKNGQAKKLLVRILNSAAFDYFDNHKGRPGKVGGALPRNESEAKLTKGSAEHSGTRQVNNQVQSQTGVTSSQVRNWATGKGWATVEASARKSGKRGGSKAAVITHKIDAADMKKIQHGAIFCGGSDGGKGCMVYQYDANKKKWIADVKKGEKQAVLNKNDIKGLTGVVLSAEEAVQLRGGVGKTVTEGGRTYREVNVTKKGAELARAARRSVRSAAANEIEERVHQAQENEQEVDQKDLEADFLTESHFGADDWNHEEIKRFRGALAITDKENAKRTMADTNANKMTRAQKTTWRQFTSQMSGEDRLAMSEEMKYERYEVEDTNPETGEKTTRIVEKGVNPFNGHYIPSENPDDKTEEIQETIKEMYKVLANSNVEKDTPLSITLDLGVLQKQYPELKNLNETQTLDYIKRHGTEMPSLRCSGFTFASTKFNKNKKDKKGQITLCVVLPAGGKGKMLDGTLSGTPKNRGSNFVLPPNAEISLVTAHKKRGKSYGLITN